MHTYCLTDLYSVRREFVLRTPPHNDLRVGSTFSWNAKSEYPSQYRAQRRPMSCAHIPLTPTPMLRGHSDRTYLANE